MLKKPLTIIISVVLIVLLFVLVGYYLTVSNTNSDGTTKPSVFRSFFPFGGNDLPISTSTTTPNTPKGNEPEEVPVNFTQRLRKITSEPTAGAGIVDVKAGSVVRYIEKATGHVFEVELFSPKQGRITNTTIPQVHDALWGNKNNSLITRYIENNNQTVDTFFVTVRQTGTTTEGTLSASLLSGNTVDVSSNGANIFYLQDNGSVSSGYTATFAGTNKRQVWSSPIRELLSQFVNTKTVSLTTKPAPGINGFIYFVDINSGGVRKILGDIAGLSTLTNSAETQVLYVSQTSSLFMGMYGVKTGLTTRLSPSTFPEKCMWSKKNKDVLYCAVPQSILTGDSLTLWYQGYTSFTDDIWKYDTKNGTATILTNLTEESGEQIDVVKPILSENEQYILFINKIDDALWSLDLTR